MLISKLIHNLPFIIDSQNFKSSSPVIIRNQVINLQKEEVQKAFHLLSSFGQKTTDIDILFLNETSPFGHSSSINYYVEVEMARRSLLSYDRLLDFSSYCRDRGIILFPILVSNLSKTKFIKNCCIMNIDDLKSWSNIPLSFVNTPLDIPGIAWDNSAIAYHILDLISHQYQIQKEDLISKLSENLVLYRNELDFGKLSRYTKLLTNALERENDKDFRRRMHDLLKRMEDFNLVRDSIDDRGAYQLTELGSEYVMRWWGSTNV